MKDTRIQSSELSDFHYRRYLRWAFVNRKTKGAFARDILVARTTVDQNQRESDQGIEHFCQKYGIKIEELDAYIAAADQNGVSTVELHQRLEDGARGDDAIKRSNRRQGRSSNLARAAEEEGEYKE